MLFRHHITNAIIVAAAVFSMSCSKAKTATAKAAAYESFAMAEEADSLFEETEVKSDFANKGYKPEGPASSDVEPTKERKLVRTGNIQLEVDSLAKTNGAVQSWATSLGGYVANSSESGTWLSISVRIPSDNFDEAMSSLGKFGRTLSRSVNSKDVTEQFYDLETRIKTKEVMLERLNGYLANAKDISDMIKIESKLNDVTSDLESMKGRMKRLSSQIDFATIEISAQLPPNKTEDGFALPDARGKFRDFVGNILEFFVVLLFIVLYVAVFGAPIVLVGALFFWLCFGKLGLVRRLFAKLRAKKE